MILKFLERAVGSFDTKERVLLIITSAGCLLRKEISK